MSIKGILIAFQTICRKEINRFTRIWTQTLLPPVITTTLYFVIFGKFIGSQVRSINGISYITFIVPGLVMMTVITNSFSNVVSSFFGSKFQRNIEELLVSPTPNWVIVSGFAAGGTLRGILVGLMVIGVSVFFTRPPIYSLPIIFLFMVLTALLFALGGLLNGIFARKFDDVSIVPTFVLTPLTYLGGIFYSIKDLPQFWQNVSKLNPILYMIDGFRYGFFGFSDVNIYPSLGMLIVFIILIGGIDMYCLNKGIGLRN
jgi:ABC-2 type transport system permease protein